MEVKPLDLAGPASVSFLSNPKYRSKALESKAGLILVDPGVDLGDLPQLEMKNAYWGFAQTRSEGVATL